MNKDLHSFIEHLKHDMPGHLIRVKKEVDPEFEIPALLQHVESRKRHPVMFFERVRNLKGNLSELPVLINLFGSRERLAYAINSTVKRLPFDLVERQNPIPPVVVDKNKAKVKEVVQTGDGVDLFEIPFITHNHMDLGPYISSGSTWVKDPDTGRVNCAVMRIYIAGPKDIAMYITPTRHTYHIFMKYKKLGTPMPMATVIGHHPTFFLGAQTKLLANEPEIIGGVMGEPLELTPSETWGEEMMVPAQAELVIETELSTTELVPEAPFGEWPGYYGGQRLNPSGAVKAVTRRKDAWYLDLMPGHADHFFMDTSIVEAYLYSRIKAVVDGTIAVHMPVSGLGRMHAYIQIKKTNEAEPKTVIAAALSSDFRIKHVIVVDEDIDIYDEEQVLWAVATRSQWDKDLVVISNMMGTPLDPSCEWVSTAKGGIDATKPADPHKFSERLALPSSVLERMKLEDYLEPEDLKRL